jgi:type VI secretion system secreted protein VgrG
MTVAIEAGMQLSLKVGGNFAIIGPTGIDIRSTLVNINSGGTAGSGAGAQSQPRTKRRRPRPPNPIWRMIPNLKKSGD